MGGDGKKGGGKKGDDKGKGGKGKDDKGKGKGKGNQTMEAIQKGEKVYIGKIKCYYSSKDIGFIHCDELADDHPQTDGDVFTFGRHLRESRAGVGDEVAFMLFWSPKGQAQPLGTIIRLRTVDDLFYSLKGTYKKTDKGFGFISCDEVKNWFGKECFVAAKLCQDLEDGEHIAFNIYLNKAKQPNCENLYIVDKDYEPIMGDLPEDPKLKGAGYQAKGAEIAEKRKAEREAELAVLTGGLITNQDGIDLLSEECQRREEARKQAAAQAVAAAQAAQLQMQQQMMMQQQQAAAAAAVAAAGDAAAPMAVDTSATPADGSSAGDGTAAATDASMDGGADDSWAGWDGSWEGWDGSWDGDGSGADASGAAAA
eukprot:TRINITY_DN9411_c0_g3_i1.p1 TRINITY_DN9411_c0_g3~~TRINITY_DN9411_c0_g3_i1.p1  ORF type:complete len:369 (+),score=112.25 TRINITY_DN9411_c0_g3_i1:43-1149(+)